MLTEATRFTFASPALAEYDDSGADFFLELVGNIPQLLGVDAVDLADQKLCSIYGTLLRQQFRDLVLFKLTAQFFDFPLQLFLAFQKFLDFVDGVIGAAAHQIADLLQPLFIVVNQIQGALAGESLDAPHSGGDAAFGLELEYSDLAGSAHMSAAAKLGGKIADFDHPHTIAVLVAEKGERTVADRLVVTDFLNGNAGIFTNMLIDARLDQRELLIGDGAAVIEVEAQSFRSNQRTGLANMLS